MIELSVTEFFVALVTVPFILCVMAGAWRRMRERRERLVARRSTMRCRYCGAPFLRSGSPKVENCPRCQVANQAGRDRRLG